MLAALCKHLNVSKDLDLLKTDLCKLKSNPKTSNNDLLFRNCENWISLAHQRNGEFLAPEILRKRDMMDFMQ